VSDRRHEFGATSIAVITFAVRDELAPHRQRLGLPFPLLADPERRTYRQFSLDRGSFSEVWNRRTLRLYFDLVRRGRRLRPPRHDPQQLGGDFVVGPDGRLRAAFRPRSPDDRPSVDELLAAIGE
jgi:peroxiredoxin